jgi:hypothetical protein
LQAKAKVESASVAMKPPWQISWPLTMSSRTFIDKVALPGPMARISMPSDLLALSFVHIPSRTASATS